MSTKKLQAVMDTYLGLIASIKNDEVRTGLNKLMEEMGERLFEAPASHNLAYHNCFVGGLAEHSLRVYGNLMKLRDAYNVSDISDDSIILVALFHDLGKVGSMDTDYYITQDSEWHRENRGDYYKHNPALEFLGGAQRSLRVLGQFGVPTTEAEYKAILIHDGQYIPENSPYKHKEGKLGLLLHQADMVACTVEKEKWESIQ
jgi:hypothetical protein